MENDPEINLNFENAAPIQTEQTTNIKEDIASALVLFIF